ncbi:PPC domain-containing DNA-binding protein [Streptomyces caatingaensis]|uniref:DNA-binding protein n=1 Tax=Streptomyces caatingaensis TaxID=1678637 RepID=A0A0K9XJM0_9ACTN|nr:PPC domain-containing DNA-binding protein [Streptomyces caatingaensis]KNB53508.1 DNA-binding protein [Streptomyces caatingaensis]
MRAHELTIGRTFGVTFDHGKDFFEALSTFCREHGVRQGYIPSFIGAFAEAEIVGACERLENPDAPVWSKTYVTNVEAFGAGTLAHDPESGAILPHIHVSAGLKSPSADGRTSHLLSAKVQFLSELLVVEVVSPNMTRPHNPDLYDVPLLAFG